MNEFKRVVRIFSGVVMKLLCDFCETHLAKVVCFADEAALCLGCDVRVHNANEVAAKHKRMELADFSSKNGVSCDICQETTGFFFCLEDRALLCQNCDLSIHSVNELVSNHKRFLVMGTRVSLHPFQEQDSDHRQAAEKSIAGKDQAKDDLVMKSSGSAQGLTSTVMSKGSRNGVKRKMNKRNSDVEAADASPAKDLSAPSSKLPIVPAQVGTESAGNGAGRKVDDLPSNDQNANYLTTARKSSIADYLTKIIPGWRVDDFFDSTERENFPGYPPASSKDPAIREDEGVNFLAKEAAREVPEMYAQILDSNREMLMVAPNSLHLGDGLSNVFRVPVLGSVESSAYEVNLQQIIPTNHKFWG